MATGAILSAVSPTSTNTVDGGILDITIEGFTTGMDWDLGSGTGVDFDTDGTDTPNITINVTSEGYNSSGTLGTIARTLHATKVARQEYPNEASEEQNTSGSDAVIRVWLNENIYDDDTFTVDVAAGTFTNSGGSSETSLVASSLAGTNNSTLDYPTITASVDRYLTSYADRVKADFEFGVHAIAGHGIASVEIEVEDESANTWSAHVTSSSATQRSATGLYAESYKTTVPISGFDQGELLTVIYKVYPKVGDADTVVDTTGETTIYRECLGRNEVTLVCDKDDLLDDIKYVRTTGDDSNDGSTSTPYLTIGKAISTGANIVKVGAGTFSLLNTATRVTSNEWCIVEPEDGEDETTVNFEIQSTGSRSYRAERLQLKGATISRLTGNTWMDGENVNHLQFRDCDFDAYKNGSSGTPIVGPGYKSLSCSLINCTGDWSRSKWSPILFNSAAIAYVLDGVELTEAVDSSSPMSSQVHIVACESSGAAAFTFAAGNYANHPVLDGLCILQNKLDGNTSTSGGVLLVDNANENNHAIVGNVIKRSDSATSTSPLVAISADGVTVEHSNIKMFHNTIDSQTSNSRFNFCYNDTGSTQIPKVNWFYRFNSPGVFNLKSDPFASNGNLTGNWSILNGVNCSHNFHATTSSDSFVQDYLGAGSSQGTVAAPLDPEYVDAANGDYTPDTGSPLIGAYAASESPIGFDLYGNPINGDIGAVQTVSSSIAPLAVLQPMTVGI